MPNKLYPSVLVSIIIPVHNGRDTIDQCIESLLSQEYPHDSYEIIVVDNNSNDNTSQVVKSYPVKLLFEKKQSAYAARNTGVRQARGDFVAFTDADCVTDPKWLFQLVNKFTNDTIVGVAGKIKPYPNQSLVAEFLGDYIRHINPSITEPLSVPGGNVAYRRKALISVGGFNDSLFGGGDVDLSWRIQVETGGTIVYNPEAIVYHKYTSTIKGLMKQYHRYGMNEIIITTIHKGQHYHQRTPKYQVITILRQMWAMVMEAKAIVYRFIFWPFHRRGRKHILWAIYAFSVESANVMGKLKGLYLTRFFNHVPITTK
jgi:cellulose synthase/poly-beta-1,6-N-acetylglucosamine synthase-like glycosyltransferase